MHAQLQRHAVVQAVSCVLLSCLHRWVFHMCEVYLQRAVLHVACTVSAGAPTSIMLEHLTVYIMVLDNHGHKHLSFVFAACACLLSQWSLVLSASPYHVAQGPFCCEN